MTKIEQDDFATSLDNLKDFNALSIFQIKHFNIIGRFSSLIFALHKETLDHVTIQSIKTNNFVLYR